VNHVTKAAGSKVFDRPKH